MKKYEFTGETAAAELAKLQIELTPAEETTNKDEEDGEND